METSNPLQSISEKASVVLKEKEKFGEIMAEKANIEVLKELITRNKKNEQMMISNFMGEEKSNTELTPSSSNCVPEFETKNLSPDFGLYFNEKKNEDAVTSVPRLDLSWLDNDEDAKDSENKTPVLGDESFSSEDFQNRDTNRSYSKISDVKVSKNNQVLKHNAEVHFNENRRLKREVTKEIPKRIVSYSISNPMDKLKRKSFINANQRIQNPKTLIKNLQSEKFEIKETFFLCDGNNGADSSKNCIANNNHENQDVNQHFISNLLSKYYKKAEKQNSDFGCQVSDEINRNLNSVHEEIVTQPSVLSRKELLKAPEVIGSGDSVMICSDNEIMRNKATQEMTIMEGWKGENKKKDSVARCYCFLCGINCGIWFC